MRFSPRATTYTVTCLMLAGAMAWYVIAYARSLQLDHDLFAAVRRNDPAAVERLLVAGASANAGTRHGADSPVVAWLRGMMRIRSEDASQEPALIVALTIDQSASDPFHNATDRPFVASRVAIEKLLLDHKADPNSRDRDGRSAILIAMESDYSLSPDFARLLVVAGADVNADGSGPWQGNGSSATRHSAFRSAVEYPEYRPLVTLMLDHGASINAADQATGETGLMLCRDPSVMKMLLARHPDVNYPNNGGDTALDRICPAFWDEMDRPVQAERDVAEVKRMLIRAGARHGKEHR